MNSVVDGRRWPWKQVQRDPTPEGTVGCMTRSLLRQMRVATFPFSGKPAVSTKVKFPQRYLCGNLTELHQVAQRSWFKANNGINGSPPQAGRMPFMPAVSLNRWSGAYQKRGLAFQLRFFSDSLPPFPVFACSAGQSFGPSQRLLSERERCLLEWGFPQVPFGALPLDASPQVPEESRTTS